MYSDKKIVIVGATGLIGRELVQHLNANHYQILVITRRGLKAKKLFGEGITIIEWHDHNRIAEAVNGALAVVNLAGESIAGYWSKSKRERILSSRVSATNLLVEKILSCNNPPLVLVQASAIGYYHHNSDERINETASKGDGFLSDVVERWEGAAKPVEKLTRVVYIRTGIVLSRQGGFIQSIKIPVKFFLGNWFGNGSQMVSWIHLADHIRAIGFVIENRSCSGAFNLVAPDPVPFRVLMKKMGHHLHRPVYLSFPAVLVKLFFGRMAEEVLLANQNVQPDRLLHSGFNFRYPEIDSALNDLFHQVDV